MRRFLARRHAARLARPNRIHRSHRPHRPRPTRPTDVGQATTEYALVMLGAAVIALLVVSWTTNWSEYDLNALVRATVRLQRSGRSAM